MAKILYYIKRAASMSPRTVIKKAVGKVANRVKNTLLQRRDMNGSTRISFDAPRIVRSLLNASAIDTSGIQPEDARTLINHYLDHQFDLLNTGWVKNSYDSVALGFEEIRYDMNVAIKTFDPQGRWLERVLLPIHLAQSQTIWQHITGDYRPIDWQKDYKSGYRWQASEWYKNVKIPYKPGVDVKIPWELARLQHLPQMALFAQVLPKEKNRLITEFRNQILDFIATNPPRMGVNWVCTMDVGIRAANMLVAYDLFSQIDDQNILDLPFQQIFANSIYEHGLHIIHNLEWSETLTSNHYLSDIAGLFFIALYLPDQCPRKNEWYNFALTELRKEMISEVYDDGTDFEASTCYHRLVLELFFYSTYFGVLASPAFDGGNYHQAAQRVFGQAFVDRLYKMFDAVYYLLKPDGRMPQIGDNDSGQFLKFHPRATLDMRYLLATGSAFFKEPRWKIQEFFADSTDIAEMLILFGKHGLRQWDSQPWSDLTAVTSRAFPNSRWYVMRKDQTYCLISAGPNGQNGNGSHAHNDKLSFELYTDGKEIIVDPGTYVYTPDLSFRDKARATLFHNTLSIEGLEQNPFNPENWSILEEKCLARCDRWSTEGDSIIFEGSLAYHHGVLNGLIHHRTIRLDTKAFHLSIEDCIKGHAIRDTVALTFNLNVAEDRNITLKNEESQVCIDDFVLEFPRELVPSIVDGFVSGGYGTKTNIRRLQFRTRTRVPSGSFVWSFRRSRTM